jgi:hypothetical protein
MSLTGFKNFILLSWGHRYHLPNPFIKPENKTEIPREVFVAQNMDFVIDRCCLE